MRHNAILFSRVDREDYWVTGGLVFNIKNAESYKDAYNEVKDKLEAPDMVNYIIEDRCLLDDLFDGDETYKFKRTYWNYQLFFEFENSEGNTVEYVFSADFVKLT